MKVRSSNSFDVRGAELLFNGGVLGQSAGGGIVPQSAPQRSDGRPRSGTYPQDVGGMMKALPPKPLPMNPAYRNGCGINVVQERVHQRVQAETATPARADTTPRPYNSVGSGSGVQGRETASRESREGGGGASQRELREIQQKQQQREAQRECGGSQRELMSREREAEENMPPPARHPPRTPTGSRATPARDSREERGAEMRVSSGNRGASIDRSTRSLSGRNPHANTAAERLQMQRRASASSAAASRNSDPGPDGDTAEYDDRFLSGYDRGRLLGRGACAVVWLAQPTGQKGYVAIKQVAKGTTGKKRSDAESAKKEIFFGSYFFHPGGEPKLPPNRYPGINHIAKLLDYSETKRDIWMVMEFGGTCLTKMAYEIKGEFLQGARLYRVMHLPMLQAMKRDPEVLKGMLRQLLSALCILADNHIVHSDIKPDNILIEEDNNHQLRCRFIDLGSAFTFDCPENLALATPEYMPPEALECCVARSGGAQRVSLGSRSAVAQPSGGRKSVDPAVKLHRHSHPWSFDIWSLGSILLEMCLGTPLWLSYKCRVADDQRVNSAATGLFAVPGRDPDKIITKQMDALRTRGLPKVLHNAQGIPINDDGGNGLELLSLMLAWDPIDRISPQEALEHPWLS